MVTVVGANADVGDIFGVPIVVAAVIVGDPGVVGAVIAVPAVTVTTAGASGVVAAGCEAVVEDGVVWIADFENGEGICL